ncbi:MAG TPA: nucleotidyltransferase domain-containing protein [Clostridia bacterium]|nr:nucleotidyltransferase domain-containing protein [Clostridia bacterium]
MYTKNQIENLSKLIVKAVKPYKVILFGSYAYGKPTVKSDVDLIVVMEDQDMSMDDKVEVSHKITQQRRKNAEWISSDISILSKNDIEARKNDSNSAVYEALRKGRVMYDDNIQKSRIVR